MCALQYPLDFYPPFASGCGFVLSWDLVLALTQRPLPDYRLLVRAGVFLPSSLLLPASFRT